MVVAAAIGRFGRCPGNPPSRARGAKFMTIIHRPKFDAANGNCFHVWNWPGEARRPKGGLGAPRIAHTMRSGCIVSPSNTASIIAPGFSSEESGLIPLLSWSSCRRSDEPVVPHDCFARSDVIWATPSH